MFRKETVVLLGIMSIVCARPSVGHAQTLGFETIKTVRESDPLIISGAIGTQSTFYHSSNMASASPLTASAYANLNISVYGITMPFSFYYATDNSSFSYPQLAFSLTPTWRGWTLLLGERSMQFSPYVYNMPFEGVGIEYQGQGRFSRMRFGTFYGVLRKAVNDDPEDPSARTPQYRRTGWGVKVGYGSSRNYLDLFLFRAQDHRSSIDEVWYDKLNAKENLSLGMRGRLGLGRHLDLSGNLAGSLYSTDITAEEVLLDKSTLISKLIQTRYTNNFRLAGDVALGAHWEHLSANLQYKQVQPDYTTLGVSFLTSNYESYSAAMSGNFGKVTLSGSIACQNDNLDGQQLMTTRANVYSGDATWQVTGRLNLSAAYSGYHQLQEDGTSHAADSVRTDRRMNSFTLCPVYQFSRSGMHHSLSLTGNYTNNEDLSPRATGDTDTRTLAMGLGYNVGIQKLHTNLSTNASYQSTDGYNTNYQTALYALTASRSFLKEQNLTASATVSLTDNQMEGESHNLSAGGLMQLTYTLLKAHHFSISASYNRYVNTSFVTTGYNDTSDNLRVSASYNYTFQALHIGRKGENGRRTIESDWRRKQADASDQSNSSIQAIRKAVGQSERQQAAMRALQAREAAAGRPKRF